MEKIPTPNMDPPLNLIIFKYVNSCNCKLHAVILSVLILTINVICRAVEDRHIITFVIFTIILHGLLFSNNKP